MGKRTARENVTSNPWLEILLRMLWAYKWEDPITVVITDKDLRRGKEKKDCTSADTLVFKKMHVENSTNYRMVSLTYTDNILRQITKERVCEDPAELRSSPYDLARIWKTRYMFTTLLREGDWIGTLGKETKQSTWISARPHGFLLLPSQEKNI